MKRIIAIMLVVLTVVGCGTEQEQITGAVLPTSSLPYLPHSSDGRPTGGWKPSKAVIKRAQPAILEYIKDSDQEIYENLDQYRCQYFGIIVDGKKRIYCNFFWFTDRRRDWRKKPVVVLDGGNWYFQLEYDVETGRCLNFMVNGES
jgi:hypothetical protein